MKLYWATCRTWVPQMRVSKSRGTLGENFYFDTGQVAGRSFLLSIFGEPPYTV